MATDQGKMKDVVAKLAEYARHKANCRVTPATGKQPASCSCGLLEALRAVER